MKLTYQFLLRTLSHQMKQAADRKLDEFGVTAEQGHTLSYIYRFEDKQLSQNDLERVFQRRGSSISNSVRNLEQRGLLIRKTNASDERKKILLLTDEGRHLVESFDTVFEDVEGDLVKGFSKAEKAMLEEFLERMTANLK
ncbi:MarR family winged helix-turn-helix transcriptional regulator [Macrococcus bovicus]|uniref:MarR family winged helix-turn-helix transcriptional regulator n=1 Tax=Macrococcus bovicus TaxID=69968 RepID=UPI0025A558CA|nr:MarR family transcriptional regulator [Macrococcus bovicus]WJP97875.1 MarR family transcriptional regulator [Macrococcus bovicus]